MVSSQSGKLFVARNLRRLMRLSRPTSVTSAVLTCLLVFAATATGQDAATKTNDPTSDSAEQKPDVDLPAVEWTGDAKTLLPQDGLGKWKPISFGGEGDVHVADGLLTIESGDPMTGIFWDGDQLPKNNYEITLEARRTEGIDFFCGLTFPVNDSHICLIVGGWAGALVGLSNIDGEDASSNESRKLMQLKDEQWYKFRIRVYQQRIVVWIDYEIVINQNIKDKKISLRGDTLSTRPMGLCTFQTTSETRNLKMRTFKIDKKSDKLKPEKMKQQAADADKGDRG